MEFGKNLISKVQLTFIPTEENNWRPRFLEGSSLFYFLIFLLLFKLIAIFFLFYFPKSVFFADITKTSLINFTNQKRIALGISPLKENSKLAQAAYLKARDMLEKDYFSHFSPEGLSPWYWLKLAGYDYLIAGENLAIGFLDSKEVYQAWLESPTHKANLLNEKYEEMGVTALKGEFQGKEVTVVVQFFGSPAQISEKFGRVNQTTKPISKEEVLPPPSTLPAAPPPTPVFNFISLFDSYYYQILQVITYASLFFILGVLLINIFVRIDIQYKDLIFKTLGVIGVLIILILLDREIILDLIPHNFLIQ